jgi:biopolymer transport protein TolR
VTEEKLVLTINSSKEIFINKTKTSLTDLSTKLENIFANRIDREIFMRADKNVPYGFVVEVMSTVRKAGVDRLGLITESPEESR